MIGFRWPWMLVLLALIPLLVGLYRWLLRRRRRDAVTFSDLGLVREALSGQNRRRRHLPALLLLVAVVAGIGALARPTVTVDVAASRTTIILALDVSRSMCAVDIEPNRLSVAQDAAIEFIEAQAGATQIGIVAFAGFAELVVPPTDDTAVLVEAVERFNTSFGTAMGSATMTSIDALAEVNPEVIPADVDLSTSIDRAVVANEARIPDIIVVLTDGANTQGVEPIFAAQQAADRRIRVFTIGFGTTEETTMVCNPEQAGADFIVDPFGEAPVGEVGPAGDFGQIGGFGGTSQLIVIDEPTLESVAGLTGGEYFRASDADQLLEVFLNLPTQPTREPRQFEVTVGLAALSAACCWAVLGHSARRFPS